jgi:major membrane immunogen (membrane-anchored lipoprotein)
MESKVTKILNACGNSEKEKIILNQGVYKNFMCDIDFESVENI